MRRHSAVLFLALAAPIHSGTPEEALSRALARLRAAAGNLTRYACIETIERQYFQQSAGACAAAPGAPARLEATDRLRLEVALSGGSEIYSWPGATRFDSRDLSEIIRNGPIGTGSFGTHLLAVFDNPQVVFTFAGERTEAGRSLLEYRFDVPLAASRYRVHSGAFAKAIAYAGAFFLDASTLDLQRLTFRASALPPDTSMCALDAELDYTPTIAPDADLLLPARGELRIAFRDSRQTRNLTTFSACREYKAESELVFDEPPPTDAAAVGPGNAPAQPALPIGLPVTLALVAPIDSITGAAGDPVDAHVVQPVRRPDGAILVPAGATVHGRLTRVEHHLVPEPYFLIAMSFNRLDFAGISRRFSARSEPNPDLAVRLGANPAIQGGGIRNWGVGIFLFPTAKDRWLIPAGFQTKWFTLATRGRS